MNPTEYGLTILVEIKQLLEELVDKTSVKSNIHTTISFDTNTSIHLHRDVHELLGLPKGFYANNMTILDLGGGFDFSINGETTLITAKVNMKISDEEIYKIEIIPASIAGTAKIRFGSYIYGRH